MKVRHLVALIVFVCVTLLASHPAVAQFTQQGPKLVGAGAVDPAQQGGSVSISSDGNTAIVGGFGDHDRDGAAWVWTRSGGIWTQQGAKLVGTGAVMNAERGDSVAISGDGNTAIVGGPTDNLGAGAAWVWTRSGGVWTQQGAKLVGSGAVGLDNAGQGYSVSLAGDGNTAIVGGGGDNGAAGAAWVWTRSGGVWTQQGGKLVGSGAVGNAGQGVSVSLSADGNMAIVGGAEDNGNVGAAWVWTRSAGVWTQHGGKLVGSGAVGNAFQGVSVSLSADGNTAIVGGDLDNNDAGATWVWTRNGGVWTQQGAKLVGSGAVASAGDLGGAQQGLSVSLAGDGNTAIVGGDLDNLFLGAAWVFAAPPAPPTITNSPGPVGVVGVPYNFTYTSTGFPTFSVTSGSLPSGLSLSSTGVISGTPTEEGRFSGTVTATNGTAPDATQGFTITILTSERRRRGIGH